MTRLRGCQDSLQGLSFRFDSLKLHDYGAGSSPETAVEVEVGFRGDNASFGLRTVKDNIDDIYMDFEFHTYVGLS
jgi:hypothetical protein